MISSHFRSQNHRETIPGFVAWLTVLLWFLLTILGSAKAEINEYSDGLIIADITPEVEMALIARGMSADAELTLAKPNQRLSNGSLNIIHASYSKASGRFVVRLENGDHVMGTAQIHLSYPILAKNLNRGEIISESDLEYLESSTARPGAYISDINNMIGKEARRDLRAGVPIRKGDLTTPILVKKGTLITLSYAIDGLKLSHQGVAQASGANGEVISVQNVQSERTVKAIIDGRGQARVISTSTSLKG